MATVLFALFWGAQTSLGQSVMHLKSGSRHECTVLEYDDGVFTIELSNGKRKQAKQEYIDRIVFETTAPDVLDAEFGLQSVPKPKPPAPEKEKPRATAPLKLASNWQARMPKGDLSLGDTASLLSKCGSPQIDLKGTNITIWGKITYLMPIQKAKKALSLGRSSKDPIACAAFPPRSFFAHAFKGSFEDGFDQLFLITDIKDQVVGVQLQCNTSRKERWFPYSGNYSTEWSLYNFVKDRKKANPNWLVGFCVCKGSQVILGYPRQVMMMSGPVYQGIGPNGETGVNEGVIRVDSELFSVNRHRYNLMSDDKSRARVRLLLAQPIVDLMLYVVQNSR
jgi:hypothetical protein